MAHLHFLRFSAFALLGSALWGGCCANDVCQADDPLADAIELHLSRFSAADLDTVILLRYPKDYTSSTRPENVTLARSGLQVSDSIIVLNNSTPFSRVGNANLGAYRYVVQYLTHPNGINKGVPTEVLALEDLHVQGEYVKTSGCCTSYRNITKTAVVRGKTVDLRANPILRVTK
ncbi:hypothetical protein [Hymenobacter convexus]|uniref:hypothetical protein n=1 Tax=Hymenobacter sp. CA1UV-4 TaxID=3063782 RepID=UPI00271356D0|nr:hypothetical protein [Hymenobacter sp. CA1UV-4]MDO7852219.1 hypothetical protein [Hymenobacter sp. CA1UV-4]